MTASLALLTWGLGCGPSHPAARQQVGTVPRTGHYVAPQGTPAGNGSVQRPWDLQFALSGAQGRVHAGDTVWLRGGTYHGAFRTALDGGAGRWIVFRQYPGERATIDGTLRA
ncbi:MAG TPA: hypothetical protein VKB63_08220, partial [Gemmatimonadales bacterium]|nr:hypothetical protein [Gemmatimonadales bacterium]